MIFGSKMMSDDRIQSKPNLVAVPLAGRTLRFETTDKVLVEVNRRRVGLGAMLPWIFISVSLGGLLVIWASTLGDGAVTLALTVAVVLIGLTLLWVSAIRNTLTKLLAYRAKYPNRWTEVVVSDEGFRREDAFYRCTLPWNAFDSIYRSEGYWEFAASGGIEVVPSEFIDAELADFIEMQATLNRVPVQFDPSFQRKLEKATGRRFTQRAVKPPPVWTWILVLVMVLFLTALTFTRPPRNDQLPPEKKEQRNG
jgi:hypothetical protein